MATFNRRGYKKSRSNNDNKSDKSQTAEVFDPLDSTANKSEQWILKNQNKIFIVIAAISISVLSYLGYERLIAEPKEREAVSELNKAQYFFEMALVSNESESLFRLALNGGEGKYGFLDIVYDTLSIQQEKICHRIHKLVYFFVLKESPATFRLLLDQVLNHYPYLQRQHPLIPLIKHQNM